MEFYFGYSFDGRPYTSDSNRTWNTIGMPVWFSRGTLHRAQWVLSGPYVDPNGLFQVGPGQALVRWEVKQPPSGTWQAINRPYPEIYAVLDYNPSMLPDNALLARSVDPHFQFRGGEWCAVWFGLAFPATILGGYRDPNLFPLRDETGRMAVIDQPPVYQVPLPTTPLPIPPPGLSPNYIPGPPMGPPIPFQPAPGLPQQAPPPDWQNPPY